MKTTLPTVRVHQRSLLSEQDKGRSNTRVVEAGVCLGDLCGFVVLRHLRERIPVVVELSRDIIPPHGEVLLD
jgi:hypothetical protein